MNSEPLKADFFKHFISEELFAIPEKEAVLLPGAAQQINELPDSTNNQPKKPVEKQVEAAKPEKPAVAAQNTPEQTLPFVIKGANKKSVAVVVNMFDSDFANITQHQMLMRLLAAIHLSADDVAFVNITGQVNDLKEIAAELKYENAILFLNPKHTLIANHKLKQFQPMSIQGKYTIAAAELSALQSNDQQKRQLWTGLQAMFL